MRQFFALPLREPRLKSNRQVIIVVVVSRNWNHPVLPVPQWVLSSLFLYQAFDPLWYSLVHVSFCFSSFRPTKQKAKEIGGNLFALRDCFVCRENYLSAPQSFCVRLSTSSLPLLVPAVSRSCRESLRFRIDIKLDDFLWTWNYELESCEKLWWGERGGDEKFCGDFDTAQVEMSDVWLGKSSGEEWKVILCGIHRSFGLKTTKFTCFFDKLWWWFPGSCRNKWTIYSMQSLFSIIMSRHQR